MAAATPDNAVSPNSEGQEPNMDVESDQEKTSPSTPDFGPVPDGGVRAWLVAAAAGFIFFSALGYANSFGVYQEYYMAHQLHNESPDKVAWVGSLAAFLQMAAGVIGGPLFDRFGAWVIRPAAIIYVFAIMMTSLCKEYWQFMLAQGVVTGISMGLLMFPALGAVSQYFEKKRAAALGLVISGSSIGGIVFPIVLSKMLNGSSLGFGWSVRILGFIMLPLLTFSCVAMKARLPPRTTAFFMAKPFKQPTFLVLIVSLFFLFLGMWTPLFFLPSYAVSRGMKPTLASYLLAILNAASTFGRIIPGILADKFGRLNILALGGIVTGIVIFCMNSAKTNAELVVYSIFFGFSSGTIISGGAASFTLCLDDLRDAGTYMGMGMGLSGVAALIGPPINGVFVQKYGYWEVCIFSGTMCLVGGLLTFVGKLTTSQGIMGRT